MLFNIPIQACDIGAIISSHSHTSSEITNLNATINIAISGKVNKSDLANVAISDSFSDLIDQTTILDITDYFGDCRHSGGGGPRFQRAEPIGVL